MSKFRNLFEIFDLFSDFFPNLAFPPPSRFPFLASPFSLPKGAISLCAFRSTSFLTLPSLHCRDAPPSLRQHLPYPSALHLTPPPSPPPYPRLVPLTATQPRHHHMLLSPEPRSCSHHLPHCYKRPPRAHLHHHLPSQHLPITHSPPQPAEFREIVVALFIFLSEPEVNSPPSLLPFPPHSDTSSLYVIALT